MYENTHLQTFSCIIKNVEPEKYNVLEASHEQA